MRATSEQLLRGLVHPRRLVRNLCHAFLRSPQWRVEGAIEAVLEAVKLYGDDEIASAQGLLRVQQVTPESLRGLLGLVERYAVAEAEHRHVCHDPNHDHHHDISGSLSEQVAWLDLDLLQAESALLNRSKGISFHSLVTIADRNKWRSASAEECWNETLRFVESQRNDESFANQSDRVEVLAEANSRHAETLGRKWSEALDQLETSTDEQVWLRRTVLAEIAIKSAGMAKYRAVLPAILAIYDKFSEEDYLLMACEEAVAAMADEALVADLWNRWENEGPESEFAVLLGEMLPGADSQLSIEKGKAFIAKLADRNHEESLDDEFIVEGLVAMVEAEFVEPLRQLGLTAADEAIQSWGRRLATTLSLIVETPFAERDAWIADEDAWDAETLKYTRDFAERDNVFYEGFPEIEPREDDLLDDELLDNEYVPPPARPFRRATERVGRNDLCPCGSGKKYKKCCLRKEQTAGY